MSTPRPAAALAAGIALAASALLVACDAGSDSKAGNQGPEQSIAGTGTDDADGSQNLLQQAQSVNQSRHVAERFGDQPVVLDDPLGFETSRMFFDLSEVLILADETPQAQLRAASVAVVAHAPMIVYVKDVHEEVIREIERLGTHTVFAVGDVPVLGYSDKIEVIRDPGGEEALNKATSLSFASRDIATPEDAAAAVAGLDSAEPTWLRAMYGPELVVDRKAETGVVPLQSRQDAEMAPTVVASPASPLAGIATARAYGATVYTVAEPDPRASVETLLVMAGLARSPLVALGAQFGPSEELSARIEEAENSIQPGDLDAVETLPQMSE